MTGGGVNTRYDKAQAVKLILKYDKFRRREGRSDYYCPG